MDARRGGTPPKDPKPYRWWAPADQQRQGGCGIAQGPPLGQAVAIEGQPFGLGQPAAAASAQLEQGKGLKEGSVFLKPLEYRGCYRAANRKKTCLDVIRNL